MFKGNLWGSEACSPQKDSWSVCCQVPASAEQHADQGLPREGLAVPSGPPQSGLSAGLLLHQTHSGADHRNVSSLFNVKIWSSFLAVGLVWFVYSSLTRLLGAVLMDFWTIYYWKDQSQRERFKLMFITYQIFFCVNIMYGSWLIFKILFQVQSFIQQILEGLGHIHSMNILHLDIKVRFLVLSTLHYWLCHYICMLFFTRFSVYTPFSLIIS